MAVGICPIERPTWYVVYLQVDDGDVRDYLAHGVKGRWVGEGAMTLGYTGPVEPRALRAVLLGWVRDGPQRGRRSPRRRLGRSRSGKWDHRPGFDLTVSPPKSVSIVGLLGGDGRIGAAHERAVRRTLEWIEKELVETRKWEPKTGKTVRVGGPEDGSGNFSSHPLARVRPAHPQPLHHCERGPRR